MNSNKKSINKNMAWSAMRWRKWRNLTCFQKKWIMEKAHRLYTQFVTDRQKFPHCAERRALIETLYALILNKGIMIYRGEVKRIVDFRMRKWNRRYLKREMEVAQETMLQKENERAE